MNEDDYADDKYYRIEDHTVASRQRVRNQLNDEIAEFLAKGGKIQMVDPNVTTEVGLNTGSDYGRQPI